MLLQETDIDLDEEVKSIQQSEPCIITLGLAGDPNYQIFICAEKEVVLESKTLRDALVDIIATYYVFNIKYPKGLMAIFLFFQNYVFGLKDKETAVPNTTANLVKNLKNF